MGQYQINGLAISGGNWNSNPKPPNVPIPMFEIIAGPTDSPLLTEIGLNPAQSSGTVGVSVGLGIPATPGNQPRFWVQPAAAYDPNVAASLLTIACDWVTDPSSPAGNSFIRRLIGTGDVNGAIRPQLWLRFPRGIRMAPGSSMVLYFLPPTSSPFWVATEFWVEWDD